jgi:heme/copper-type cytochrome/quinol oxidase subunit 2
MFGKLGVVTQKEYDDWAKGKAPAPATAATAPAPQNVSVANR